MNGFDMGVSGLERRSRGIATGVLTSAIINRRRMVATEFGMWRSGRNDQAEYQVRDRLSFSRFLKLGIEDRIPDGTTLWLFREKLSKAGLIEMLFERFGQHLEVKGYIARGARWSTRRSCRYRSAETEAKLDERGFKSRIHCRASRNHPLSDAQVEANRKRSKVRVRIEHVFGAQENAPGGRIIRTIGEVRARAKIDLQNLVYNVRRLVILERTAPA
jgi:IS5 family transposase